LKITATKISIPPEGSDPMTIAGISVILLTQNNEGPVQRLLDQFLATNTHHPVEFIVIDHGSTDRTVEIISRYAARAFFRTIKRGPDHTPAASYNLGANRAQHPNLLFMDSNMIYTADILPTAIAKLEDATIGAVGVRLDDDPDTLAPGKTPGICHAGVEFKWDSAYYVHLPVAIRHESVKDAGQISSGIFSAVGGDFLLCRKTDFEFLGGFCDAYDNGYAAIDFCLQLAMRLNQKTWCINDIALQLTQSMAQAPLAPSSQGAKQPHNASIFKQRMGSYVTKLFGAPEAQETSAAGDHLPTVVSSEDFQNAPAPLNILFVLYERIDSNCGQHVQLHAERLAALGACCRVAVPDDKPPAHKDPALDGMARLYSEVLKNGPHFADGRGPDIIHAWTPREVVRQFCEKILQKHPCPLIIHLEDNESYLTEVAVGRPFAELEKLPEKDLDNLVPGSCYHPIRGRHFLDSAQGLTLIIDTLSHFNKTGVPSMVLPSPVDERLFYPRPLNLALRKELCIPHDHLVLAYTGNVHAANRDEVIELYRAVYLLNEQGCPTTLIRTGINLVPFGDEDWITAHEKALGWVERHKIPDILAAADILVQPGSSGPLNDQRVPSKLPEYFAMGRPVVLPQTNMGLKANHLKNAFVLAKSDPDDIANAINYIKKNNDKAKKIADSGIDYYLREFSSNFSNFDLNLYFKFLRNNSSKKTFNKIYSCIRSKKDAIEYFQIRNRARRGEIFALCQTGRNKSSGMDLGDQVSYHFGTHRSGWGYVVDNLKHLSVENGLYFDTFIERSMIWGENSPTFIDRDWIGVIHNPPYIPKFFQKITKNLNFENLLKTNPIFRASLKKCRGLITLSKHHKEYVESFIDLPVKSLLHPTEFVTSKWNYDKFLSNKLKKIVQIGWWLRKLHGIYMLEADPCKMEKLYLTKNEPQIIKCFEAEETFLNQKGLWKKNMQNTARPLGFLADNEYDNLLTESIVFIDLYDSSANNAIIECVSRNTPILVNQIPSVVEYLGESYPMYYETYEEASQKIHANNIILDAHLYLKKMNKEKLSIRHFSQEVNQFVKDITH
jgi:glycosyltransferase involved in cell wall biosynthesis